MKKRIAYIILLTTLIAVACRSKKQEEPLFELLQSDKTGLHFTNKLTYSPAFNLFKYIYFYNGSGLGAGDFNQDGLIDLFFAANQVDNKLFLNKGKLQFTDVTKEAAIPQDGAWSTGVSVVDINNDGLLDIYVCRVGNYEILHSKNQLLLNTGNNKNGVPQFREAAAEYGLDFSGFSTQAAFFDMDIDGDLDMYLLNHSVHENGTFRPRNEFEGTTHPLSGDRIYRNDNNKFVDITASTGIGSTAIGYGLGIAVSDIDLDGYPDIYIGNDFHENDYLYINQRNGKFRNEITERLMHTSQFSMGVDVADVNNDAFPEIISMDMLPEDPYILRRSLGEDTYNIYNYKIRLGYFNQYTRNNLQYNLRNGQFSEVGFYSGVAATDWSWAPLWVDFNNDGLKDLFVSNGIPKRMNDIDYINFLSNGKIQEKIKSNSMEESDLALINKFPEIKLPNKFFLNQGDMRFSDEEERIKGSVPTFSNGSAYADLDNDGDLDIIVNNIENEAMVYENKTSKPEATDQLKIVLKGSEQNRFAVGSKVVVYKGASRETYEKYPVRGFMSSMEAPLQIGLGQQIPDSMHLIWPDNTYQSIKITKGQKEIVVEHKKGGPAFDYSRLRNITETTNAFSDLTDSVRLGFTHEENPFVEFDREPLIPHMNSTEGPAVAVADIDHDGLEDVFIGAARDHQSGLYLQTASGELKPFSSPALQKDSIYENIDAVWADVNKDGHTDLIVASGGNEFYGEDPHNSPRVYLNDGHANLTRSENAIKGIYMTASSVIAEDFNADGAVDLFFGARTTPFQTGAIPSSYLLINDGKGQFTDRTAALAPELPQLGFVTNAVSYDMDADGDKDLVITTEWGPVVAMVNEKGRLVRKDLIKEKGWWNFALPFDINGDGLIDLLCGNLGWNSRLKATEEQPLRLYYNDFDQNGTKEQLLTYYIKGNELPFANKAELESQLPMLKKKFLYAEDLAKSTLHEMFEKAKLDKSTIYSMDYLSNAFLINKGNWQFEVQALPWKAQLTPYKAAVIVNANNDALPDLLLFGNYYDNNIEMGRYDADYGTLLINKGKGEVEVRSLNGLAVKGQVRRIKPLAIRNKPSLLLGINNGKARVISISSSVKK